MNHACLTTEPVNVHNTMLALVFAVAIFDLGGMFLRSMVSFVQLCILLGVEEMHWEVTWRDRVPVHVVACDSDAFALVADRLIVPILSVATYLIDMWVPNPSLANAVNEKRSPRRIIALLLCTCIACSWFRSAVATIQSLNFGGISHHGWQHTKWLRYPRKMDAFRQLLPFLLRTGAECRCFQNPIVSNWSRAKCRRTELAECTAQSPKRC